MAIWKDASSYSRGDTQRIPSVWETRSGSLRVAVHRHIHYGPDAWLLSCVSLGIDQRVLTSTDVAAAQREGLEIVVRSARRLAAAAEALAAVPREASATAASPDKE